MYVIRTGSKFWKDPRARGEDLVRRNKKSEPVERSPLTREDRDALQISVEDLERPRAREEVLQFKSVLYPFQERSPLARGRITRPFQAVTLYGKIPARAGKTYAPAKK